MPTKSELLASTAAPKAPQRDQAERSSPIKQQAPNPVDPCVAARMRGAFDGSEHALPATTAEPGRPQLPRGPPFGAYSLPEFARAHSLSESFLFKLLSEGRGPAVMRIGRRTLISVEAAARWRAEREAAARNQPTAENDAA